MNLNETSLEDLKKDLTSLLNELNKGIEISTKELGKKSLDYMKVQYAENNMGGHTSNLNLHAYKRRYKKGFVISSGDDEVAVYNEFGTGVVGEGTNPLADAANYKYNVQSPYKGYYTDEMVNQYVATHKGKTREQVIAEQTPNTWWYWKNGTWRYTEGMAGKNMFSNLTDELLENSASTITVAIGQVIGKGGKK